MEIMSASTFRSLGMVLLLSVALGCGGSQEPQLHGSVTYNGQQLSSGAIMFIPANDAGRPFGAAIERGTYSTKAIEAGQFTAVVRANLETAPANETREQSEARARSHPQQQSASIPETAEGNSQNVKITGEEQTIDFSIKGPPG
jgi:hypothetical protein